MESSVFDAKMLKEIMERKLQEKDLRGAILLARRAHNLYPQLKRLFQFLGNIVVPVSIEDEEIDWYTVLGVHPNVDCKTMKQHYVELVRVITEAGSYEAYKILDKAWLILSNMYERKAYDMRRRSRVMQLKEKMSIGENIYAPLPSTASWSSKMTIQPGIDNVLGMYANVDPCINVPHNQMDAAKCLEMSSVEKVHGSSINVPHNQMDAAVGVKQMGNPPTKKVGVSRIRKGNSNKKRRSDEETSFLVRVARNEIRKKLDEWKRPRIKYTYSRRNKSQSLPYNVFGSMEGRGSEGL